MTRRLALQLVDNELARQDAKWGEQNHHPFHYLAILGEEYGEACQAAVQATGEPGKATWTDYADELVQIAAVAVAMLEAFYRDKWHAGGEV